jgi:hypothetical protein
MALIPCPKCGELNEPSSFHCAACGADLKQEETGQPEARSAARSLLAAENIKSLLGVLAGVLIILLGIFVPGLASAIIQFVLIFTSNDRLQRRTLSDAKPSAGDGWWVVAVGVICIFFFGMDLYGSWKKGRSEEKAATEQPEVEEDKLRQG